MEDAKTVRYVSKDPIQNLKVRVSLWRLSVQASRVQLNNPNPGGQAPEPGQAQATQEQALTQGVIQQPIPQPQQLPQPQPQPGYDLQQHPVASQLPGPEGPPAAGPFLLAPPGPQQQQQQPQQQQQVVPAAQLGSDPRPQGAAQAVTESSDGIGVGLNGRQQQPQPQLQRQRLRPANGNGNGNRSATATATTRQRMPAPQRFDDAAAAATVVPAPREGVTGGWGGWSQAGTAAPGVAMGTAAMTDDPFRAAASSAPLGGGGTGGGMEPVVAYERQPRRQGGQPLGEAIEDPSGGGGGDNNARMMARRQQAVAQQAAFVGGASPASMDQPPQQPQQQQQQQQPAPQESQQQGAVQSQGLTGAQLQPQPPQQQQHIGLAGIVIPPQVVPQVVPYGSLGAEARMAATGQPPEVPPTTPQHELPEKFKTSRVFGWQEKVYSRTEVAAAQAAATTTTTQPGQQAPQPGVGASDTAAQQPPQEQQQQQAVRSKRLQAFGSQSALDHKGVDPRTRGSILYTFVQTDDFCVVQELGRTVTTSPYEEENVLVSKLLSKPKGRAQVLSFRSMYVMADLGDEGDVGASNDKVLVSIRAFPDGSFDMCPGFSRPGLKYRFEDKHGGIFEYTVENASATDIPSLEKRTAKLERAVVARAEELRRAALKTDFEAPPAAECTRLLLLGEILSAADFLRNHLYIEYVVRWDPDVWDLTSSTNRPPPQPGIAQGVTHISRVTVYPADPATDTPARDVAHFAHPLELEWISRPGLGPHNNPPPNAYPCVFFQACTLDKLNRYTSEGYGWLSLDGRVPGSGTHVIRTWKPLGTIRDRQAEFFTGGSPELADLAYVTTPSGFNGKILNKFGFKTESIGAIKVRLHTVTQRFNPDAAALADMRRSWGSANDMRGLGGGGGAGGAAALNKRNLPNKRDLSLKMVVERARQRLREARGTDQLPGGGVAVRPGVVSEAPTIIVHPQDTAVSEDSTVRFKVVARGLPPLSYEWYKDDRRMLVATADQPELVLVQASLDSEGAYHCQVSNKDGSASSSKATLTVTRAARVTRTAAGFGPDSSRASRRQQRGGSISISGGADLQGPGGTGGGGAPRMSRLARLDAAVSARTATGGSIAGSDAGGQLSPTQASAGPSPRESTAGAQVPGPGPDTVVPTD